MISIETYPLQEQISYIVLLVAAKNDEDASLFLFYYPDSGWVGGDANHAYIGESENGGWTLVIADGSDDGDDDYHDAEIMLIVGWNAT